MSSQAKKAITKADFEIPLSEWEFPETKLLSKESTLREVVDSFCHKHLETVLIGLSEGETHLEGILTERDFISKGFPLLQQKGPEFFGSGVEEIMTRSPISMQVNQTLLEAISLMARGDFRHIPLVDESSQNYQLLSLREIMFFVSKLFPEQITAMGTKFEWDILEVHAQNEDFSFEAGKDEISGNIFLSPLQKAIYREALCCDLSENVETVVEKMRDYKEGAVVITQYESMVKGIFTERDFIKNLASTDWMKLRKQKISSLMTSEIYTLLDKHVVSYALNNMLSQGHRRCIIVNEDNYPVSVVSMLDLLKFLNHQLFKG